MPYSDPRKQREYQQKYRQNQENRLRQNALRRLHYAENADQICLERREYYQLIKGTPKDKNRILKNRYHISLDQYEQYYAQSGGYCPICRTKFSTKQATKATIDHCHKTGKVRGILCRRCNTGLGLLRDNPLFLQAAINWLK